MVHRSILMKPSCIEQEQNPLDLGTRYFSLQYTYLLGLDVSNTSFSADLILSSVKLKLKHIIRDANF